MRYLSGATLLQVRQGISQSGTVTTHPLTDLHALSGKHQPAYQFLIHPYKNSIYAGEQLLQDAPELQLPLQLHPADAANLIHELQQTHEAETPAPVSSRGRLQALDGQHWIDCQLTAYPLPGAYKDLLGWHVMAAQHSPPSSMPEDPVLQVLANLYKAGKWVYFPQPGSLTLDDTLRSLLNLPEQGITPLSLLHHLSKADQTRLLKKFFAVQRRGGYFQLQLQFRIPDLVDAKSITLSGGAFYTEDGTLYLAGICFDTTQAKRYDAKHKHTATLLEETQDLGKIGSFEWNPQLHSLHTSPQLNRLLGMPADASLTPARLQQLLLPADLEQLCEAYSRLASGQSVQECSLSVTLEDGQQRNLWLRARLVGGKGQQKTLIGIVQDIIDRDARQPLPVSKDRILDGLLKALPVSILTIGTHERIVSMTGASLGRVLPSAVNHSEYTLSEALPELVPEIRLVLGGATRSFYTEHRRNSRIFTFFHHYFFDEEQQLAIGFSLDITDQKQAERTAEQVHLLEHRHQLMDTFVHAVAHDLRGPVVNLGMLLNLFKEEREPAEQVRYVTAMNSGVQHLRRTLDALIELLRLEKDYNPDTEQVQFQDVLEELKEEWGPRLQEANGTITTYLQCDSMHYSKAYMSSILRNLISNAIKYSAPNRPPQITICTEQRGDLVLLLVQDNGIGIDLKKWKHLLFQPFKRLSSQKKGTGIGLHLIRQMIEKNGGKIKVKSQPGEGTTFYCFLRPYR